MTLIAALAVTVVVLVAVLVAAYCASNGETRREVEAAIVDYLPPEEDPVSAAVSAMTPPEIRRECEQIVLASKPWSVRYRRFEGRQLPHDVEREGGI